MGWKEKVGGTVALIAGVILAEKFASNMPNEVILAWGTLVPALWVIPPVASRVGAALGKLFK